MNLFDALWHYDALVARVPLHQWRDEDSGECPACWCEYVQLEALERQALNEGRRVEVRRRLVKACIHRERGHVEDGVPYRAPYHNPKVSDPMAVVALKADIDRQIDAMPPMARRMFDLLYRSLAIGEDGRPRRRSLGEVRAILRRPWDVVTSSHDYHLRRMERTLADWFPRDRRSA
jgi:hypothetical protein